MNKKILYPLLLITFISEAQENSIDNKDEQLHAAAADGNLDNVKKLLLDGVNVNRISGYDTRILHIASENGHVAIINELLKAGAIIDDANDRGTALHFAAESGQAQAVKALVEANAEINVGNEYGETPIFLAFENNYFDIVDILIKNGANFGLFGNPNQTEEDRIQREVRFKNFVEFAIDTSANEISQVLFTPYIATIIAQYLHGFVQYKKIYDGTQFDQFKQLKNAISDCSNTKRHGENSKNLANIKSILDSKAVVNWIYSDIDKDYSPLSLAASNNSLETVKLLLAAKAEINNPIANALGNAAHSNHVKIVKYLLDNNACIKDYSYYFNALSCAIKNLSVASVFYLLKHNNKTAEIDISTLHNGHKKIAKMVKGKCEKMDQIIDLVAANFNDYLITIAKSFKPNMPNPLAKIVMSYIFWHTRYLEDEYFEQPKCLINCIIS